MPQGAQLAGHVGIEVLLMALHLASVSGCDMYIADERGLALEYARRFSLEATNAEEERPH